MGCGKPQPLPEIPVNASLPQLSSPTYEKGDWPGWRGAKTDGIATGKLPPTQWSATTSNVIWSTVVPGRGHSSPIVIGNQVFLTTAEERERTQSVICFNRVTGLKEWMTEIHTGGFDRHAHPKNTQATPTLVSDRERLYALFLHQGFVWLTCLDLKGEKLWSSELGPFLSKFGFASSPLIHGSHVIVVADHDGGGFLTAVHRQTGDIVWRKSRPAAESYATPAIYELAGKPQIVIAGGEYLRAYQPEDGHQLWEVRGTTQACVGSPVRDGDILIASGGYPEKETLAIQLKEASHPEVLWRNKTGSYVPSLLTMGGFLYQVTDKGILSCWHVSTGKKGWESRLSGEVSASPVACGDLIYITTETGVTHVVKANPLRFELISSNTLGEEQMASPAICDGQLLIRAAKGNGPERVETLYCIGERPPLKFLQQPPSPPAEKPNAK